MIKSILTEHGLSWTVNRILYSGKLKLLNAIPLSEKLFERSVDIKRIDVFDANVKEIEDFLNSIPEEKQDDIRAKADLAIDGKIIGFSSVELDYGNPINWHYNPITQATVDKKLKWYQIPDFDPSRGDIKVIWEASRFTHFLYFARAYLLTKDRKYYQAFSNQLESWIKENPYSYGPNFKCGQEATLRMINALLVHSVFDAFDLITKRDRNNLVTLVETSYKKVLANFFYAHKCIRNNHTLSEIVGLIIGAWSSENESRLKKAYQLLEEEIDRQFFSDGGYIQFSFNYQRFALQILEVVLKISKTTGIDLSERNKKLISKSAMQMYNLQDANGDVPNYGANDGALIFPVTVCNYRDYRPTLNSVYGMINGERLYEPSYYDEEMLWFSNESLDNMPIVKKERQPVSYKESGLYSLRNETGFVMIILKDLKTRPGQMDQLHIDLWHKGRNLFCDSGTYSYATELGKQLSLTQAHNTVKLPNRDQMNKYGHFLTYDWTSSQVVKYDPKNFISTMVSKNGYEHTRNVEKTEDGYRIVDEVRGESEYCEVNFHTPYSVKVTDRGFELYEKNDLLATVLTEGEVKINNSYRSLYYLRKEEINRVSIKGKIINNYCKMIFKIKLRN